MSKCEKEECLLVEVHKHQSKPFTYIVSNGIIMLGELKEDDITKFLSAQEVKLFYGTKLRRFLVPMNKLKIINKPKYY